MQQNQVVAIIQARMGSTRLPGKVMKHLCGKTVLAHVISRVQACQSVNEIIVATTVSPSDDLIVAEAERCGVRWYRGDENDVLSRYYLAAKEFATDLVVRVTSDCPLFDPNLLTKMIELFIANTARGIKIDYLCNVLPRTYPRGLDVEIFTRAALEQTFQEARQAYEREHVTPYIYQHPELFMIQNVMNYQDLSSHRWTLDTDEDWMLITEIYNALYQEGKMFTTNDVLKVFDERPELFDINTHVHHKTLGA